MQSRIRFGPVMMLAALLLSVLPAAAGTARPAEAASPCDWAQFVADVTVPDGTNVAPGLTFSKTWRLKNIGTCTWTTSYALVFSSGSQLGGPLSMALPNKVAPGQTVDLSVSLTAPNTPGHYIGFWQLKNAANVLFGLGSSANKSWWVDINVLAPTTFGVAYDFAANFCAAGWYTIQGALPCPGSDGDSRGFVLKVDHPQLENGTTTTDSGLILVPQNVFDGDIHGAFPAFRVQSGDRFRSVVNCAFGATSCFVTFRLDYQVGDGPVNNLWSLREKYDGMTFRTDLDLSSLAGQDVKFILTVLATGSADGDRALWVNPIIARPGNTPPAPYARSFDFGTSTSPLATGYTRVTESTVYTTGAYGWASTSGLASRDRTFQSDALKRDFVTSSSALGTFKVDLPNGKYAVTVTMGDDLDAHDNMVVKANGATVLPDVDTAAGVFAVNTFNATVSSDTLSLQFSDAGGTDPSWVVNGILITAGSTPPPGCSDRTQFVADVTVPDGTTFAPGAAFVKTWRLKNIGTCTWTTSYAMVFDSGEKMGGPDSVPMPKAVAPGSTVEVSVNLTAPSNLGSYRGFWKFQNASGARFGLGSGGTQSWWVDIKVAGSPPTPPPASCNDRAQFVADVNVPDGTSFAPGAAFTKTWRLKNVGTCTWTTSYAMVFDTGDKMGGPDSVSMPLSVSPGQSVDISVNLAAPATVGSHRSFWRFQNASGVRFGLGSAGTKSWWVDIKVSGAAATATPTPTGTRTSTPTSTSTTPPSTATSTPTQTPSPTFTPTPTPTGTTTSDWNTYLNGKYLFSFKFPPGSVLVSQSDNQGQITLPITRGTNLVEKRLTVNVAEGVSPCKSPVSNPAIPPENVTFNGIQFLKETWVEGATSHRGDNTAYSTAKGNACITLTFLLWSVVPEVVETPPPRFDQAAESAVFLVIMSSYANQ